VALARAFAPRPRIILADEPTGNLDEGTGARVMELLFKMQAEDRATLVLVTHDRNLAGRCGRTASMHSGRMEEK
jgi:putative ABC transport system ATP-binding protein